MSTDQFVNLGLSRRTLEDYLTSTGYWAGINRTRQGYTLSPMAYVVSKRQQEHLAQLGRSIYAAVDSLNSRIRSMAGRHLDHQTAAFRRLALSGVRGLMGPDEACSRIPPVMKVDLVQDIGGLYRAAEVDVYNPRGYAYMALLEGYVPEEFKAHRYAGMNGLVKLLRAEGYVDEDELILLRSEFERFYDPSFRVLCDAFRTQGIANCRVATEGEFAEYLKAGVLYVDGSWIFNIPESLFEHPQVALELMDRYKKGKLRTFYPPKSYLGSKGFLPFLREHGAAPFIPKAALVTKKLDPRANGMGDVKTVLKGTMSSGHKKVIFSDLHPDRFEETYAQARRHPTAQWVLQEQVAQQAQRVSVFSDTGELVSGDYYLRLTAYITRDEIIDVEVTGLPRPLVSGAPDCIQIPCIRE